MTKEEAYDFCYEHQTNDDDYELIINSSNNTDFNNGFELRVVCNGIYHYMNKDYFEELVEAMKLVTDDFDVYIDSEKL